MPYDLLIKNGRIVDGTGAPAYHGNIAAADGRIVEIGDVDGPAARVIDASDLDRQSRLYRPAYALRRANLLGSAGHVLLMARRDHGDHGQLRRGAGAVQTRRDMKSPR